MTSGEYAGSHVEVAAAEDPVRFGREAAVPLVQDQPPGR